MVGYTVFLIRMSQAEGDGQAATSTPSRDPLVLQIARVVGGLVLLVLGAAAVIAPTGVPVAPAALRVDVPVMLAVAIACLPIFFTGFRIDRWEGALFLALYVAYTAFLVLDSQGHDAAGPFGALMLLVVLPLVTVTLAVLAVRALRRQR